MRVCFALFLMLCVSLVSAAPPTESELPNVLRDWRQWVMHGEEYRQCPAGFGSDYADESEFICAWPSALQISVSADGAEFNQTWQLFARSVVPLPGDESVQPLGVLVDGAATPVLLIEGEPALLLEAGTYRISGSLKFAERPESIRVSEHVARVDLSVDGRTIFPLNRSGDRLWLGRAESTSVEADALSLQVFRLLADGIPARLETRMVFEVSGKGREEVLPPPLPPGFEPISLSGDLPARLESDGKLHVQVRPGTFTVRLLARALTPLTEVTQSERTTPWPVQEVWSYASDGSLRVSEAGGPPQIDPNMAEVPGDWRQFPAFMLEGKTSMVITESSRGMASADQNRLNLSRQLWLDFDGGGWTLKDQINGSMKKDWRLDVRAPLTLGRATENGEPSLITRSVGNKALGVEVRQRDLNLATTAREESGTRNLPVTGWMHTFDSVNTNLQLPPGYRLWAALGIDSAPQAWLDRWDLLDVFFAVLTVVLFAVCFGRLAAIVPLVYVALAWHEPEAPRISLMVALALLAVVRAIDREGRFVSIMRWIARGLALIVLIIGVPFMIAQVRFALYPQLLGDMYGNSAPGFALGTMAGAPMEEQYAQVAETMPAAEPAPASAPVEVGSTENQNVMQDMDSSALRSNMLERKQVQAPSKKMRRYESNSVVYQNGYAEPSWNFSGYQLNIQGPVEASQNMRLLITPPWLTAILRFFVIASLAWCLVALVIRLFKAGPPTRRLGLGVILLAAGFAANASEPPVPPDDVLAELGMRLREAPDCAPHCARVAEAEVRIEGERVTVGQNIHAAVATAVPLPGNFSLLSLESLSLDGVAVEQVISRPDGLAWILVGRGVHRLQMTARMANVASVDLVFPLNPGWIDASANGWDVSGINEGRLSTGTLNLTRVIDGDQGLADAGVAQRFAPFVRVTRHLRFDLDWSVQTTVQRLAPETGAFSIELPLIVGERVLSADAQITEGRITLPFSEGASAVWFESRLDTVPSLELDAPELTQCAEVWQISASPTWNVLVGGLPGVHPADTSQLFEFYPLPKERLNVQVTRPEAMPGGTIAFDQVTLQSRFAKRSVEHDLSLQWRATQGGQHGIVLPEQAEVLSVTVNGQLLNLRPEKRVLRLPITPGTGSVQVVWRHVGEGSALRMATPEVDLKAPASNISLGLNVPEDRWTISASGPRLGPAVLYWGELLAMILIALALSRSARSSLKLHDWLLLGIGFSTVSWFGLFVFAGWLFLIDWRKRLNPEGSYWRFDLLQIGFVMLTLAALIALFVALTTGLVGQPDLHVISRGWGAGDLKWFNDLSDSVLPQGSAVTLPIWLYRALMLAWAFWMAWSLVRWGRNALAAFMHGGVWQPVFPPRKPAVAPVPAAPAEATSEATAPVETVAEVPAEPNQAELPLPPEEPKQ